MNILQLKQWRSLIYSLFLAFLLAGLAFFLLVRPVPRAMAQNCTVPGSHGTIQAAIDAGAGVCNTITIGSGTFNENLTIDRSLTLQGAGKSSTTIDGGGTSRVVTIDGSGITVRISDLRITNGDATAAATASRNGGGILVTGGAILRGEDLQIDNNLASSAVSGFGGGVAINTGSAYLTDTMVLSNRANDRGPTLTGNGQGGGIYVNGPSFLSLVSNQVMTNTAAASAGTGNFAAGGGLYVNQSVEAYLNGNTWQANVARGGNSAACDSSCVGGNVSEGGGAIGVYPSNLTDVISITLDIFTGNIANDVNPGAADNGGRGGAISLNASSGQVTVTLTAVTMSNNIAARMGQGNDAEEEGRGGAIFARKTDITVKRANIYNNQAAASGNGSGGGLYTREPQQDHSVEIINTILAGNLASGGGEGAQIYVNHVSSPANNATKIVHATLADNTLNPHEALFYHSTDASDTLGITNTIVANHAVGIQNVNVTGRGTARYMLFFGNTDNHPSPGTTAFPDMTGWVAGDPDPLFIDPPNDNYHIGFNSPAIDAGIDAGVTDDIDGDLRPDPDSSGFDIGADDYITKPIKPRALMSRISAMFRRGEQKSKDMNQITIGDLAIDKTSYLVTLKGNQFSLPKKEFELLYFLAQNPNKVFSRDDLLQNIWGTDVYVLARTVDVHVRKVREKIGEGYIKTVKGVGYKFELA